MRRGAVARLRRQYILLHALHHQQPAVQVRLSNFPTIYASREIYSRFLNEHTW